MSHFSKIKTKLYDRVTLEKSLSDLNIKWEVGSNTVRGYNDQEQLADIVILPSHNHLVKDVIFKWNNNQYELVTDLMFSNQAYSIDKFLDQVHQRYVFNLITKLSEEQGLQFVESENQEDDSIRLLLRKVN
jgi:hypothetical protein